LTPEEINSQEDLKKYIKVLIMNNPDLTSVTVNGNTVTMERTISGKFLGLIAVPVQETAEVTNWGGGGSEVSVISPWWNIFSEQYSDDQITEKLYIKIKTIPTTQFGVNLNTQTQGRILSEMDSTFNEHSVDVVK
jgi:hypothetical protein